MHKVPVTVFLIGIFALLTPLAAQAQGTLLRGVDWGAVLQAEPRAQLTDACMLAVSGAPPCLMIDVGEPGRPALGYPLVDSVVYGDIDGDGLDEAVILVFSGGTAGNIGFLVYHQAESQPRLVVAETGYKVAARIVGGQLIVDQPYYFASDPNCCPSAVQRTPYRLAGERLVAGTPSWVAADDERGRSLTTAEVVVRGFYNALNLHRLPEAYAFLSPRLQGLFPYEPWAGGYGTMESVEVETRPGTGPNEVGVTLRSVDRVAPDTGETRRFTGTWRLVASDAAPLGLLLDDAQMTPVP